MLPEQQQRIMGYFIEEAKDHLNTIEQGLLNLQNTIEDPEMINEVFRAAHSVKGGAAMLGIDSLQQTSHQLEDCFKILKECPVRVDQHLETLFLQLFDALQELLDQLSGPFGLTDEKAAEVMSNVEPTIEALKTHLNTLVTQAAGRTQPATTTSAPANSGVGAYAGSPSAQSAGAGASYSSEPEEMSALQLIFQSDVPARLRDMLQLFKQADNRENRQKLQEICRVLRLAGEQFELPNWCELLSVASRAIANPQNTYHTLAPIVIKEIKQAQELVLANRDRSIFTSEKLSQLLPKSPATTSATDLDQLTFADLEQTHSSPETRKPSQAANPFDANGTTTPEWAEAPANADLNAARPLPKKAQHTGPQVGTAELNSLADLFEGETPDLDSSWEDQEMMMDKPGDGETGDLFFNNLQTESDREFNQEFADLLFEESTSHDAATNDLNDEFASLFGEALSDEENSEVTVPQLEIPRPAQESAGQTEPLFWGLEDNDNLFEELIDPATPSAKNPVQDLEALFSDTGNDGTPEPVEILPSEDEWAGLWNAESELSEEQGLGEISFAATEVAAETDDFSDLLEIESPTTQPQGKQNAGDLWGDALSDLEMSSEQGQLEFNPAGGFDLEAMFPETETPETDFADDFGAIANEFTSPDLLGEESTQTNEFDSLFELPISSEAPSSLEGMEATESWLDFESDSSNLEPGESLGLDETLWAETSENTAIIPSETPEEFSQFEDLFAEEVVAEVTSSQGISEENELDLVAFDTSDFSSEDLLGELFGTTETPVPTEDNAPDLALTENLDALFETEESDLSENWFDVDTHEINPLTDDGASAAPSVPDLGFEQELWEAFSSDSQGSQISPAESVAPLAESVALSGGEDLTELDGLLDFAEPETASSNGLAVGLLSGTEDGFAQLETLLAQAPKLPRNVFVELDEFLAAPQETGSQITSASVEKSRSGAAIAPGSHTSPGATQEAEKMEDDAFADLEALIAGTEKAIPNGSASRSAAQSSSPLKRSQRVFEQTMRVPVRQLDNLSNLVGELVVNRNSLEQDQERLRQFLDNLLHQVSQLSDVGQRMQDLYERSLLEISLLASRQGYHFSTGGKGNSHATGINLEALEMDRFTPFHTLSQEILELIVRVRESASDIDFMITESGQVTRQLRQVTSQLQEGLNRSRMVPFGEIERVYPLARAVRDGAVSEGKQAELRIEGRDTLIDKLILEHLSDPLKHLINNAIAHGIETPDVREAAGKSPVGRIVIRAFHQGNQTVISFSDDGAGIDVDRVKQKAIENRLITPEQAGSMSRLEVYELLFLPGFSTKEHASMRAGRGVGMDVVRNDLGEIRGAITIDSNTGKGTTFTIRLPLTLSISKALCCISDRARIAFPMDGVEDMLDVPKEHIQTNADGQSYIPWRDTMLPFRPLRELLVYNRHIGRGSVYGTNAEEDIISVVVLRSAGNFLALQVDQVLGEQEIVIKQLEGPVPKPVGVAGATVMGDGRIVAIADVLELIDLSFGRIRREGGGAFWEENAPQAPAQLLEEHAEPTVLIVDDSITVRELLSMTFNKAGYRVEQARDGQEAWEKLRSGLPCDIVFCDIEMPRMDGLELLSRMQKDPILTELPIAMLTSRGADRHRQMAVQLGARGYFTKPYLEEALLEAASRMLKGEVLVTLKAEA